MFGTEPEGGPWAQRHAWITALCVAQALLLAVAILIRHSEPGLAIGAALTLAGPAASGASHRISRGGLAAISAATLVLQATILIVVFGENVRAHVVLLAVLCIVALYEVGWVFAVTFAAITLVAEAIGVIDPAIIGLQATDRDVLYFTVLSGAIATGVGAVAIAVVWTEHRRLRHQAEQDRRVSEAYLGVSGSIVVVMDEHGIVTKANRQACLVLDREEDEIVGRDWYEIAIPQEYREEGRRIYAHAFSNEVDIFGGGYAGYENEVETRSGERRAISWWATMLEDRRGNLIGMVCAGTDLTDSRATKAALDRNNLELAALRRLAQKVASLDDSRQAIVDAAVEVSGAQMASIAEPDRTGQTLTIHTCSDDSVRGYVMDLVDESSLLRRAFVDGRPQFMGDLERAPGVHRGLATAAGKGQARSALHQPIVGADGTVGVLSVAWDHTLDSVQDRRAELIGLIAHEAAIALRRRESLAQLERAALVDPLTGVANRRAFDAELPIALRRAVECEHPLGLIVMDLNEFKAVNDVLGHEAGDEVLIKAASAWAGVLRAGDLLARLGGDEFAVLLPTCDATEMDHIIARLRIATPHGPGTSLGGVVWDGTETAASFIRRADAAQYDDKAACKRDGRSRTDAAPRGDGTRVRARASDPRADQPQD